MANTEIKIKGDIVTFGKFQIGGMKTPIRQLMRAANRLRGHESSYTKTVLMPNGDLLLYHAFGHVFPITNDNY